MAHYAFLDENNKVVQVIVGKDENEPDNDGNIVDWEVYYGEFEGKVCKRTSYNTYAGRHNSGMKSFRKNFAGIGYTYDEEWDAFIPPRPYPSWKLNYETFQWEPPIPMPELEEGYDWKWGEINQEWVKVIH